VEAAKPPPSEQAPQGESGPEVAAAPAAGPPRVVEMKPRGTLNAGESVAWRRTPSLELRFDQPMRQEDLTNPARWLQVFRVHRPEGERGLGRVKLTAIPITADASTSGATALYRLGRLPQVQDSLRDACYLVLILDGDAAPRTDRGDRLAARFAGTELSDQEILEVAQLGLQPGETGTCDIEWTRFFPRNNAVLPSGAGDPAGGHFHASFLVARPGPGGYGGEAGQAAHDSDQSAP
jgi:hypothetical protein